MRRLVVGSVLGILGLAWVSGLTLGLSRLNHYESAAGPQSNLSATWPTDAPQRNLNGFTLAVFLHPQCPCSHATLSALDKINAHAAGKFKLYIFAVMPDGAPDEWQHAPLIESARQLPGAELLPDPHARLARQFNALTSGQTILFDADGRRIFAGGITQGRGHDGPTAGANAIESLLAGKTPALRETPVFGCSLANACPSSKSSEVACPTSR